MKCRNKYNYAEVDVFQFDGSLAMANKLGLWHDSRSKPLTWYLTTGGDDWYVEKGCYVVTDYWGDKNVMPDHEFRRLYREV